MTDATVKVRPIREVAADLRKTLNHTQQSWATLLGWSISSAVRFENGGLPSAPMLWQMLDQADKNGLDDLAAEVQLHLNAALGPDSYTMSSSDIDRYCVLLLRRIMQNKKRREAFLRFATPEIERLKAENALRHQREVDELAAHKAYVENLKKELKGAKK